MSDDIDEAAARWHFAQADDDMDWHGFTQWLEADPRHRHAYDAIALLDERVERARPILRGPAGGPPVRSRRRPAARWGWAAAAAMVGVVGLGVLQLPARRADPVVTAYHAPAGRVRAIRLADGSTAALAPGSVLRVAASRDVPMTLEGRAYFDVRHDAAHPLVVRAGGYEIRDVGTRFEIASDAGMLRVAVAQGRVAIRSPTVTGAVEVAAGQVLTAYGTDGAVELRPLRPAAVGRWRSGGLVYDDVPLALVAADISRYVGAPVSVDPGVARRRFSGVIAPGDRAAMVATLEQLTGLDARTDGDAIRLGDRAGR